MRREQAVGCGGCAVALVGAVAAVAFWVDLDHTQTLLGEDFEGNGMDMSAFWTRLPFVALAGALLPAAVWALAARALRGRSGPPRG